jgi:glycosyltransferase involved in cell wall biosynthesis
MSPAPSLSIVIPTHNRAGLLERNLSALAAQTWPAADFEVLVVADSCSDDTAQRVVAAASKVPYQLRLLSHSARSAARTRNLGAQHAAGTMLLFLDDDVIPLPDFVQAHLEPREPDEVVLGYSKPMLPRTPSLWQYGAYRWWEDIFRQMGRPDHRFTYRDFFSGNVSLSRALFQRAGRFDQDFQGRLEDYELGLRLLKTGARFRFKAHAVGHHYDYTDLAQWLRRIRQEGIADIQIGDRHPELRSAMFGNVSDLSNDARGLVRKLAFVYPQGGDRLEALLLRQAHVCERLRLRYRWHQLVWLLREYNYWRGVASVLQTQRSFAGWLQEGPALLSVAVDAPVIDLAAPPPADALAGMLRAAERRGLRLMLNGVEISVLAPQHGAAPLEEAHLQSALRSLAQQQFIPALSLHLANAQEGYRHAN